MDKNKLITLQRTFDSIVHLTEDGVEYWLARELQSLFGYIRWENFETTINRAIESCKTSNFETLDHFLKTTKMVGIGSRAKREITDYRNDKL